MAGAAAVDAKSATLHIHQARVVEFHTADLRGARAEMLERAAVDDGIVDVRCRNIEIAVGIDSQRALRMVCKAYALGVGFAKAKDKEH